MSFGKPKSKTESGAKAESGVNLNSSEVVIEFKGNLREVLNANINEDIYLVEVSSALATPEMMKHIISSALPEDLKAVGYGRANKDLDRDGKVRDKDWCNCGHPALCAGALALLNVGAIKQTDIGNLWGNFVNCSKEVNISGKGESGKYCATANGFWFFLARNAIWLVQYKSPNAGGQQYMAPFKWFTDKTGVINHNSLMNLLGRDEVMTDGVDSYEYTRLQSEHPLRYRCWSQRVSTGYVDWCSKEVYTALQYVLPLIAEENKGLRNIMRGIEFNITNDLCRESVEFETRPFTQEELEKVGGRLTDFTSVNESISIGRESVPKCTFED